MKEDNALLVAMQVTDWLRKKQPKQTGERRGNMVMDFADAILSVAVGGDRFTDEELLAIEGKISEVMKEKDYISWDYDPPREFVPEGMKDGYSRLKLGLPIKVYFREKFGNLLVKCGYGGQERHLS